MDFTASRSGQVNAAGDVRALFLKKFAGEVMVAFAERNIFMPLHSVRTIDSGKSAQFPATGKAVAEYHVPGTELNGQSINHAERVINIDDLLVSHTFIANIDEAMNHYDVRSIYSTELGRVLASEADKRLARVAALAARASATVTGLPGGTVLNAGSTVTSNDTVLSAALFSAAQKLDENEVGPDGRVAVVRPAQYYLLVKGTTVINRDWGGKGSYADGKVIRVADIDIYKSNHVPSANASVVTGEQNTYNGTFDKTVALVFTKEAFGTVKLRDLAVESEYSVRHQGTLMVAKYAMGHGILRPECAYEIDSNA